VRSDVGPFTIVPHWLLDLKVSDKALRLYVALGKYADRETGEATPGRKRLAEDIGVSRPVGMKTLDRVKEELVVAGALRVDRRRNGTANLTNLYVLVHADPRAGAGGPSSSTGSSSGVTHDATLGARMTPPSATDAPTPARGETDPEDLPDSVDGTPTSAAERRMAREVLSTFCALTDTRFTGQTWLRKIILRLREHPEADVSDHERAIRLTLQDPWWSDDPTPAVVYGNESVFENALNRKEKKGGEKPDFSRFTKD
jgi:hypothetical protein